MRVSLNWLRDYVDVEVPLEKLVELLDFSGSKVETVRRPGEGIDGIVVAEVIDFSEHPNADSLTLVDVDAGDAGPQRVVCGARNLVAGDRVPLATVGAHLSGMRIDERKIRGEVSRGMLCSAAELGISKDSSGILVLPGDAELGSDVVPVLGLDDTILELEITPNRADCMGLIGIAREVAALLGVELRVPPAAIEGPATESPRVTVEIDDPEGCTRYVARRVEGVRVAPSPLWMNARLLAAGVRPISNVVDITNYVMLETGQPLHAFDATNIQGGRIIVRRATQDEKLITLDGVSRVMSARDLLIADSERVLGIAGVMGGADSEVAEPTTSVIIEAATFDKASISFTSRRHSLRTEASARFERGADPEAPPYAASRAARFMSELAGGSDAGADADVYPRPAVRAQIRLRPQRTNGLLGIDIAPEAQAAHLEALGLKVRTSDGVLEVEVPSFRGDLTREADLIEEVGRLEGLDKLPATLPPGIDGGLDPAQAAERSVRRSLSAFGLFEAWTPAFMPERDLDELGLHPDDPARSVVRVANPMTEDERCLRTTLLPALLRSAARNRAHGASGVALFEVARVYEPTNHALPRENLLCSGVFSGLRNHKGWNREPSPWSFFAVKGILEALFESLRLETPTFAPVKRMPFHSTRAAHISLGSSAVGIIGDVHPEVCERVAVPDGSVAFELALGPLLDALPDRPRAVELPKYPSVNLDVAVVVDAALPASTVSRVISDSGAPELDSVRLFDVYEGEQVPAGKKSLAYALRLRAQDRTLTDEEGARVLGRIVSALQERTGGELRA